MKTWLLKKVCISYLVPFRTLKLAWDQLAFYATVLSDDDDDDDFNNESKLAAEDQYKRLEAANLLTQQMTKDEYITFSECRQASFTFKKLKKFREWLDMSRCYD